MTSEQNKKLPLLVPKEVIGIKRRPNRRDLVQRNNLQGLPDPDTEVVLRKAALNLEQAAIKLQQTILEMNPVSDLRVSLTIRPDPTPVESESELDDEDETAIEDAFIAKVRGVEVRDVTAARVAPVLPNMPAFIKKVRAVNKRGSNLVAADAGAPFLSYMLPGTTRDMTVTEAALAFTNEQAGTSVTMKDLRTSRLTEDLEALLEEDLGDAYRWTVGSVNQRELTVAEAALVLTNMQAGTNMTMQDLRTAREMVDLWDNEDTFHWTVGNFE